MRPSRSSSTCAAVVGLGRPKELALGAAIGMPAAAISARATGCDGTRTPTSGRPAVTTSGTSGPRGSSSVSGPGQNASISARAWSLISATSRPSGRPWLTCTITGSHAGRCFAAKMRSTAFSSKALAPSPYTVSVGNATVPPARQIVATRSMVAAAVLFCRSNSLRRRRSVSAIYPLCGVFAMAI